MQLKSLYIKAKDSFEKAGFETPEIEARALIESSFSVNSLFIYTKPEFEVDFSRQESFNEMLERRLNGEPVSYITGYREFYSTPFHVNDAVLIPRPETEVLVEEALKLIPQDGNYRLADIGAGSGCIGITICMLRTNVEVVASDISFDALAVARKNTALKGFQKRISFIRADLLGFCKYDSLDMVISNPPYVSSSDYESLQREIVLYEPRTALFGGQDGLELIRKIIADSGKILKNDGWCLIEVGIDQSDRVEKLFIKNGFEEVSSVCDLNGIKRVVQGKWKK